jgi:membrane protein CcdC involved in cytochrome C biogenesis
MPILVAYITIPIVNSELISAFNVAVILAALIIGLLGGILIGKFFEVKIDENGAMILKGSFIAVFIWIAIILLKVYGKNVLGNTGFVELNLLTAAFLIMTLGAMVSRRIFVYWKYLNFKKEEKASKQGLN